MDFIKTLQKERKNAHFLLVDGISKLGNHKVNKCQSSVFDVLGLKWKLIIHPVVERANGKYVSIYLKMKDTTSLDSNWEVTCSFNLSVVSQNPPHNSYPCEYSKKRYKENEACHGSECLISHWLMNYQKKGYLVNDQIVFCAEITDVQTNFPVVKLPRFVGTGERLKLIDVPRNISRFTWKITQLSSFKKKLYYTSYDFTVGPRKWRITMSEGISTWFGGRYVATCLEAGEQVVSGPKAKTLAVYKLRVLDQLHGNHREMNSDRWFRNDRSGRQVLTLSSNELEDPSMGFLVNDQIYLSVDFLLVSTTTYL